MVGHNLGANRMIGAVESVESIFSGQIEKNGAKMKTSATFVECVKSREAQIAYRVQKLEREKRTNRVREDISEARKFKTIRYASK